MPSAEADGKPGLAYVDAIDTFFGYHPNEQGEYVQKGTRFPPGSEGVYYRRTVPHTVSTFIAFCNDALCLILMSKELHLCPQLAEFVAAGTTSMSSCKDPFGI